MTSTTQQISTRFAARRHHIATTAALIVAFWMVAAALVAWINGFFARPDAGCVVTRLLAILVVAWLYVRLTARDASVEHTVIVGISWVLLGVTTEMAMTETLGHPWFRLLGAPHPSFAHNLTIIAWLAAPTLFARVSTLEGS